MLVKSYKWVNNTTFDFDLRKIVKFSDGTGFDANDVVATFNHVTFSVSGIFTKRNVSWMKKTTKLGPYKVWID